MRKIKIAIAPALAAGLLASGAATAHAASVSTRYVSPSGHAGYSNTSCSTAGYSSINAAVAASSSGDTVMVCSGTYHAEVIIRKPLNLIASNGAVIDATGQARLNWNGPLPGSIGIGVLSTSDVRISGFQIQHAGFDGIFVAKSSHVSVSGNVLQHNGDVGVDLNGTTWCQAVDNDSEYNTAGGFLVADDNGPTSHNVVSDNVASHNPGGGGVIVAGHGTAGVTSTTVADNQLTDNGTLKARSGAGVVISSTVRGETVANNIISGNTIYGNGLAGVAIHAHLPSQNMNGNQIIGNTIGMNGTLADPIVLAASASSTKNVAKADTQTTGILVGAAGSIQVQISDNNIYDDENGIFLEGVGNVVNALMTGNTYSDVMVPVNGATA
jgi:parallel beta-helix repeat protein